MNTVFIQALRRIRQLSFPLPEQPGVYLLTGANGAGKSTLISCLAQVGRRDALNFFFKPDVVLTDAQAGCDVFAQSLVRYEAGNGQFVEYHYQHDRWLPADGSEAALDAFGYPAVLFSGKTKKRVLPPGSAFSIQQLQPAPDSIRNAMCAIFDDERYAELSMITEQGENEQIYLLAEIAEGKHFYFSDNNFSSGERAVLKLITRMQDLPQGSLLLVDEAEMALHPKSQKRLLTYLTDAARRKSLTVIVSTQSASIIKITNPKNILFLENDENNDLVCRTNVYPAAVLGEMAFEEEILPETILLVEDPEANMLLDAIVTKLKSVMDVDFPYCKILPVGGYMQVVTMLDNLSRVLPDYVKRRAVLDQDAESNIKLFASDPSRSFFEIVHRNMHRIYFLPCAPEQGIIRLLEQDPKAHTAKLNQYFGTSTLHLADVINGDPHYREIRGTSRSDCKSKLNILVKYLSSVIGDPQIFVRKKMYRYYVDQHYDNVEDLKREYCPLIFRR